MWGYRVRAGEGDLDRALVEAEVDRAQIVVPLRHLAADRDLPGFRVQGLGLRVRG